MNDWFTIKSEYLYNWTGKSTYKSDFETANNILAIDTEKFSHTAKIEFGLSTVNLYQQKQQGKHIDTIILRDIIIPLDVNISAQKVFSGQNIPSYSRIDAELRLYF